MKKILPSDATLQKHIDHFWIVKNIPTSYSGPNNLIAFPGVKPDLILILEGVLSYQYQGQYQQTSRSQLCSFIKNEVTMDLSTIQSFVIIQFKARALASLLPFIQIKASELMKQPVCDADLIFGDSVHSLSSHLRNLSPAATASEIEQWLLKFFKSDREGFITDLAADQSILYAPAKLMARTKYSYSTLERYFKKETGLTPKRFQSLHRYKFAVEEIFATRNTNWSHYVGKYGYYDQSHFIKEVKRYTSFTPAQLLAVDGLLNFRRD